MARGWESKSVEAQIEASSLSTTDRYDRNNPSPGEVQQQMKKAALQLSRKQVVQQLESTSNERYTELLRRSLAELDSQIGSA
jgi:hypothetical protein